MELLHWRLFDSRENAFFLLRPNTIEVRFTFFCMVYSKLSLLHSAALKHLLQLPRAVPNMRVDSRNLYLY